MRTEYIFAIRVVIAVTLNKSTTYPHIFFILTSISSEHFFAAKKADKNTNPLLFMSVSHSPGSLALL
jgi:hypothetical protein